MKKQLALTSFFLIFSVSILAQVPEVEWVEQFSGGGIGAQKCVISDDLDNLYICGQYGDTADLEPGPGEAEFISAGMYDFLFRKLLRMVR